ncbi:MAG: AarF/ABC1/UbiB kinase family protein [Desulfobacteraceae bacterium]|nr:MAG: AarF/ABC1/UbiB kinase family protein [Desulfobacteraceae bacterium]
MQDSIPKHRLSRTLSTSQMAVKIGGNQLGMMIKRPFLSEDNQKEAQKKTDRKNAAILFNTLAMLRGTALKAAQLLSLETDILPEDFRQELEKSYHQVPPMNRALVRKIVSSAFSKPVEEVFNTFDLTAFAAASLGQVHKAVDGKGRVLAVKIQYPDISKTISSDIRLLKTAVRPMAQSALLLPILDEVESVLMAETDYEQEAENIRFFKSRLVMPGVRMPDVFPEYSTPQVLTMSMISGTALNQWLSEHQDPEDKNRVAQTLHDIFLEGFYGLHRIHADPNPGNFLIADDLSIGLVDFGCVKSFDPSFISLYRQLIRTGSTQDKQAYADLLEAMNIVSPQLAPGIRDELIHLFMEIGQWFHTLYRDEVFDFAKNHDFIETGKRIAKQMQRYRNHFTSCNPDFVFLDRTRYGLLRLFEKMQVKIRIQNSYEC